MAQKYLSGTALGHIISPYYYMQIFFMGATRALGQCFIYAHMCGLVAW